MSETFSVNDFTETESKPFKASDFDTEPTTAGGAFARGAATAVVPAAGAALGGAAGWAAGVALAPETGGLSLIVPLVGAFAGGLIGSAGAEKTQEVALETLTPETSAELKRFQAKDFEQHPVASAVGRIVGALPSFEFAPGQTIRGAVALPALVKGVATEAQKDAAIALAVQAGVGTGGAVVAPLVQGQAPTLAGVAEGAVQALIFGKPRFGNFHAGDFLDKTAQEIAPLAPLTAEALKETAKAETPAAEMPMEELPTTQPGSSSARADTSQAPVAPVARENVVEIAKANPNSDLDYVDNMRAHLDSGKPIAYSTSGDGKVRVGYDVTERAQANVKLTKEENREFRLAELDLETAKTPDERAVAKADIQRILRVASERMLGADSQSSTVKSEEQSAAVGEQPATPSVPVSGFTTAKGSTYEVHSDGTTTRNKAARPEHPGEQGPQQRSQRTFYLTPEDANKLALIQTQGGPRMAIEFHSSGAVGVRFLDGPNAGKWESSTMVRPISEPAVGLMPVELWKNGRGTHFGNEITSVNKSNPNTPSVPESSTTTAKFKIGKSPQTYSLVERLTQSEAEKANGEQPVSVKNDKTGEVQTVMESDLTPVKSRIGEAKTPKRDLNKELTEAGLDPSSFSNAAQKREALKRQKALSQGPGGASVGDVPVDSELSQLTRTMTEGLPPDSPLPEKINAITRIKEMAGEAKESVVGALAKAKAVGEAMWDSYKGLTDYTDEKEAVGKWTYANQKADFEARKFQKTLEKAVPDPLRREAMTNWIQADGKNDVLQARADASKGRIKRGYEAAMNLTDYERTLAGNVREYLDSQLAKGIEGGILKNGVENYVNQIWKRENPITKKIVSDFQSSKLEPNFKFARQRVFDSYFEGEQAGFAPANKDVGALIALYDQAFNKTLSARAFLKDLHAGNASDGRPLVEVSGSGKVIDQTGNRSLEQGKSILVKPRTRTEETYDYRKIDHPAMRGWKWIASDPVGNPVLLEGDLLVHPEAYAKLRNRLQSSAWRTNPVGKAILDTQSTVKQTMLSISGFHQVQETLHALGHRVNPLNLDKIDFDNPTQKALVEHGLQLADYHAMEAFSEGLSSGALVNKIPWVGNKILKPYTEWLFQDYIPRLKVTMANHALERNTKAYGSKLSRDQILELTAREANSAFGELNYKYMGRNPTLQDTLRAFLLAPDFLEARAGFVGQAAKPFGREQLVALGVLAATQYIAARLWNKMMDGDYHWNKPFSYIYKEKEYGLRTVPADIAHLIDDQRRFVYNRLSPLLGRGSVEAITGRDDRGVKRDALDQLKDLGGTVRPISTRVRDDMKLWEAFLNSFGMHEKRFTAVTETYEAARKFKQATEKPSKIEEIYDAEKDEYRPLRVALLNNDMAGAQKAYYKLKESLPAQKISDNMHGYYTRPFTGSAAKETKFIQQLDEHGKETYKKAKQERQMTYSRFQKLKK